MKKTSLFVAALTFQTLGLIPSQSSAGAKEVVSQCLQEIEIGNLQAAREISMEIRKWKHLFATQVIKDSEKCLTQSTGVEWRYMPTKSRFLSGDALKAELDYVNGASQRIQQRKNERDRLLCQQKQVVKRISELEDVLESLMNALSAEAQLETYSACEAFYSEDRKSALLNPLCQELFRSMGIPGSSLSDSVVVAYQRRNDLLSEFAKIQMKLEPLSRAAGNASEGDCG